ncbi:MAG: hypothetical protein E7666_00155 [Ruminococcaceae bacterium]|nr:hypothetical protein [Oscillospiraceae bacterium]
MRRVDFSFLTSITPFDHNELMSAIGEMCAQYDFLDLHYIGTSILNRPIPLLTVGNGARKVLYVGAHHGMEWITSFVLCRFLASVCDAFEQKEHIHGVSVPLLFDCVTLCIIPMLNPDGVSYQIHGVDDENPLFERVLAMNGGERDFQHWQANARGVDLNHNYDACFHEYKKIEAENGILQGAPTRFSGEHPESEPEVSALCNWIRFHENVSGILTLHTQGEEIYYRCRGTCAKRAPAIAERISSLCGYRLAEAEGAASFGGLTDWCALEARIPCFTLECGRGINPLPFEDAGGIYRKLERLFFRFPMLL